MKITILRLLALYIDFIIVKAMVALLSYLLGMAIGYAAGEGAAWYGEILVSLFGVAFARKLGIAPGLYLQAFWQDEADAGRRLWPNLVLGTFLILEGLKSAVRWTDLEATLPVFGIVETSFAKVLLLLTFGVLYMLAGLLLLCFTERSKIFAGAVIALSTSSFIVSWPAMQEGIARAQTARRSAQDLPLREGEIEAIQAFLPYTVGGGLVLMIVLLILSRQRSGVTDA